MHPLTGRWMANLSKSQRHANHQFHSANMRFDVVGPTVALTYEGVNASGRPEGDTVTLHADGQERDVPGAPGVVASATLGARALETVGKKDGIVIGRGTYGVSEDGQTLTATVSGIDAAGLAFEQVIVFDRDAGSSVTPA